MGDDHVEDSSDLHHEVDTDMNDGTTEHADTEMMAIMDVLQTLGVDVEDANRFAAKVIRTSQHPPDPSFVD